MDIFNSIKSAVEDYLDLKYMTQKTQSLAVHDLLNIGGLLYTLKLILYMFYYDVCFLIF